MRKYLLFATALVCALVTFTSCGGDDDDSPLSYDDIELTAGDTYTIDGGGQWESDQPLVASVSNGVVTAERVGTTRIHSGSTSFYVTVNPKYDLYDDPCFNWGASETAVKNFMRGYTLFKETDDMLIYHGKKCEDYMAYSLENGKLTYSMAFLDGLVYSDQLGNFLLERYIPVELNEDELYAGFVNIDMNMAILLTFEATTQGILAGVGYTELPEDLVPTKASLTSTFKEMADRLPGEKANTNETRHIISNLMK